VIDEIAFQTNILAQRCAQASQDAAALIGQSILSSNGGKVKLDQVFVRASRRHPRKREDQNPRGRGEPR